VLRIRSLRAALLKLALLLVLSGGVPGGVHAQALQVVTLPLAPLYGIAGDPLTVSAVAVPAPVSQFQWDFGDGQLGFGQNTSHTYAFPGTYTITLTALGPSGPVATGVTTANISPGPNSRVNGVAAGVSSVPVALGFVAVNAYGPYNGSAGSPVSFSGSATGAGAPQFSWDFGDGTGGTGATVTHVYATPGSFIVRLTVFDTASGLTWVGSTTAVIGPGSGQPVTVTLPVTPAAVPPIAAGAPVVRYAAGWNLVAGPAGTSFPQALGLLYTWQPGDTTYESLGPTAGVQSGAGYWAYFPQAASVSLTGVSSDTAIINLSPGEVVLAGNPSATATVTIRGADSAMTYDPANRSYRSVQTLAPGAAAWISVGAGGAVTLSP
jgi:PKD repeat protein